MQDLVSWPGMIPWPPALGVPRVKCWSTQEVPLGGYITGPKAEVLKKWPLSPFKTKKKQTKRNCLHKNWPTCVCIYMVPRVLTGTDLYNCHHNENTEEFHHQKHVLTSNSPNTAHVCWSHSPAFSRMSYKWILTAHGLSKLALFQHRRGCTDGCRFTEGSVPGEGCHSGSSHSPDGRC